jgi:hypothetical protein
MMASTRKARAKALRSTSPATKRAKASPDRQDLKSWLAGYDAGARGVPHSAMPRGMQRVSWLAGHVESYKHRALRLAVEAAKSARHHGGEQLAAIADQLGCIGTPQYMVGFLAGVELGAGLAR